MDAQVATTTNIRRAHAEDTDLVAGALAQGFENDPIFGWCIPDPSRRAAILPSFFRIVAQIVLPYERTFLTSDTCGAAMWIPPGCPPVPEHSTGAFEGALAELLGPDAERTFALMQRLDEAHPRGEYHFLWFLGVTPRAQGRGIGSALLSTVLARLDRDGEAAYLDATSERNRHLYERHGFETLAELTAN